MNKFEIINHAMVDGVEYSIDELSELVKFRVTMHSVKALLTRGLISESEKKYTTTQRDLFTPTKTAEGIYARNMRHARENGPGLRTCFGAD